jgi:Xaa-Pro aminopeptidase
VNVLIFGDTETSPALRHEVPTRIVDPFLYAEADGRRAVVTNVLDEATIAAAAPDLERLLGDGLGRDELIAAGNSYDAVQRELSVRAVAALGIKDAIVPPEFPLGLADRLRESGVSLTPDEATFAERRRRKTEAELAGIRRAADAGVSALRAMMELFGRAEIRGDQLWVDGDLLTAEAVRAVIRDTCANAGAPAPATILVQAMGPNSPGGHDAGSGPLPANTPILVDLWPRDERSGCWADMTRMFARGTISDELHALHRLVVEAHTRACKAVRPGVTGAELHAIACEVFEQEGHPTQRTKRSGETLSTGFYHSLGHGVGLQVHEEPALGLTGSEPLIAGDVIAVEPGTVVPGLGGARVEDTLLVTGDGWEPLTGSVPLALLP